jgi:lipopolysaccharide biosynthesis glycosyltransferase
MNGASGSPIHIALTFDDNYWAPAFAVMRSICLFTHRRSDLVFHLFQRGVSPAHQTDLDAITTEFGARLVRHDLDTATAFADIAERVKTSRRLSNVVYARLLIDRLLPPEVERIIYLDCDTMVRDRIEDLYSIDMQGYPVAAVRDVMGAFIVGGRDIRQNRDLFDTADPYFNSGMLLIDVPKYRAIDVGARLEAAIADGVMARIYYDQDLLNLIFKTNWLILPPRWNTIDAHYAHEASDPAILHYTGRWKPWHLLSNAAFRRTYRHVMTNELFYRFMRHRWRRYWLAMIGR